MGNQVSHETYYSTNEDANDGHKYYAKFESQPFEEGACRYAFKGTLFGDGPRTNTQCVTKVFKTQYARNYTEWVPDLAASKKAKLYAERFCTEYGPRLRNYISGYDIDFLIPLIAKMQDLSHFKLLWFIPLSADDMYVKSYEYVALEPFISGIYEKFNSNGGHEVVLHALMTTFCHWTWQASGHEYMVCDLQGVKSGNRYILTDPAIHSRDRIYGPTDLGVAGMEKVLANHTCNTFCQELGLDNPLAGVYFRAGPRSTTYSFQLTEEEILRAGKGRSDYFAPIPAIIE